MKKTRLKKERYPDFPLRRPRKPRVGQQLKDARAALLPPSGTEPGIDTISEAIRERRVVAFRYGAVVRTVEPHCCGVSRAGNQVLRAYETNDVDGSGTVGWRLFNVNKIAEMHDTGRVFEESRPGYNPNDRGMTTVHCRI